jgi:predicted ATP-dependent protease
MHNPGEIFELSPAQLRVGCEPVILASEPFTERSPSPGEVGQARALEAIDFGLEMDAQGYNLFVVGAAGSGRITTACARIEQLAKRKKAPPALCYVNNFQDPRRPRLLTLPPGKGQRLRASMAKFARELGPALTASFESPSYQQRKDAISQETHEHWDRELEPLRSYARTRDIAIQTHAHGFRLAPMKNGEVLDTDEARARLSETEGARLQAAAEEVQTRLREFLLHMPPLHGDHLARERELDRSIARDTVRELSVDLRQGFAGIQCAEQYLDEVERDIMDRFSEIVTSNDREAVPSYGSSDAQDGDRRVTKRYGVNLIVDHSTSEGAPVVLLDHASVPNLIGRIEHDSQLGVLVTDFSLIKPGALHRANGGYLVVDAYQLLSQPFAWEQLKRALRSREIRFEPAFDAYGFWSSVSQEPDPVPLDVKVILIGEPPLYQAIAAGDPQFADLFKIVAEFEETMRRDDESCRAYAQMLSRAIAADSPRSPTPACLARVIEESARSAADARRLDLRVRPYVDLLREADQHARKAQHEHIELDDLERALHARERRHGRLRDTVREHVRDGLLRVETSGRRVGQVNALSLIAFCEGTFGVATRVSARARLGRGEVVDIEREVSMAGPSHSKSVLILGAYLGGRYLVDRALSLRASLVFEQTYGFIEGDSSSLAELLALLSAIAEVPLPQEIAVTGSIDQHGFVQAVSGLHEKIEGFFATCLSRSLTGTQGVIIPRICAEQLMLEAEVVEAARAGKFHIYAVDHVDEAIRIMIGQPPGERGPGGSFPPTSFHGQVEGRLERFAAAAQRSPANDA